MFDLGLGQRKNGSVFEPSTKNKGYDASETDDSHEAQDKFGSERKA
jgi:hypothetical protein